MSAGSDAERIAGRLRELSEKFRDPELPEEEVERLAREAAELTAQGGAAIEEALRKLSRGEGENH